jgi:glycosyltransferase involved in cell wall biosynthesis
MIRTIVESMTFRRFYLKFKSISQKTLEKRFPWLYRLIFFRLKSSIKRRYLSSLSPSGIENLSPKKLFEFEQKKGFSPLVSVIIPNYNHAPYLRKRLETVYQQTYQNIEVILLDDCSSDDSSVVLKEFAERYKDKSRLIINEQNSGAAFRQWRKGFNEAKGDYVWIAESDDYCDLNFIETLVPYFQNPAIQLAYCPSVFVNNDNYNSVWTIYDYLSDIDTNLWKSNFLLPSHQLVQKAWSIKNIVPNASSAIFKKPSDSSFLEDPEWQCMKICGDWIFYLHIIRAGLVAYDTGANNYYRIHESNSSASTYSKDSYYQEHEKVAKELVKLYSIDDSALKKQEEAVKQHWRTHRPNDDISQLTSSYNLSKADTWRQEYKPNIMMLTLGFSTGGGETFPILMANLLDKAGYTVTFVNFNHAPTEAGIRQMLQPQIPVIELSNLEYFSEIARVMGIDIVHSHHAWVDSTVCQLLLEMETPRVVITSHGMYEAIAEQDRVAAVALLAKRACKVVYIAEKNLLGFEEGELPDNHLVKIENALPVYDVHPVSRSSLNIPEDAFVVCIASRAIAEKGWAEAISIVSKARRQTDKDIRLVLAGNGEEYTRLSNQKDLPKYVHLLGFRGDVRELFAMSDLGMLPTRFKGESAPLVLIECLHAGRPMLASDVGEVKNMLTTEQGMAGMAVPLIDWQIDIDNMADRLSALVEDKEQFINVCSQVPQASQRFMATEMISKYEKVYFECCKSDLNL